LLAAVAAIGVAYLVHIAVEMPTHRLGQRWGRGLTKRSRVLARALDDPLAADLILLDDETAVPPTEADRLAAAALPRSALPISSTSQLRCRHIGLARGGDAA
jgi:hypothetical protein